MDRPVCMCSPFCFLWSTDCFGASHLCFCSAGVTDAKGFSFSMTGVVGTESGFGLRGEGRLVLFRLWEENSFMGACCGYEKTRRRGGGGGLREFRDLALILKHHVSNKVG